MTLAEFLLARIAEDEVRATMREWHAVDCDWIPDTQGYTYPCDCGVPERLKAECEAKWQIVRLAQTAAPEFRTHTSPMIDTLLALASVYANHPDYRAEWRP